MTRVWLVRHGEPEQRARNRCYGSLNIGLSEAGRAQVGVVAKYLAAESLAAIYCSPRSRAVESAEIITAASSITVQILPELAEINFGDFEGLTYDEIAARYPDTYREWMTAPTRVQFPNGESFPEMRQRVLTGFQTLLTRHADQTLALVSHGGVNRILIAWALEMPDSCLFRLAQPYAAISLLEFVGGVPNLRLLNGDLSRMPLEDI